MDAMRGMKVVLLESAELTKRTNLHKVKTFSRHQQHTYQKLTEPIPPLWRTFRSWARYLKRWRRSSWRTHRQTPPECELTEPRFDKTRWYSFTIVDTRRISKERGGWCGVKVHSKRSRFISSLI
jgi:hypothetical protein